MHPYSAALAAAQEEAEALRGDLRRVLDERGAIENIKTMLAGAKSTTGAAGGGTPGGRSSLRSSGQHARESPGSRAGGR